MTFVSEVLTVHGNELRVPDKVAVGTNFNVFSFSAVLCRDALRVKPRSRECLVELWAWIGLGLRIVMSLNFFLF